MKRLILILLMLLSGCAHCTECQQIKEFLFKDPGCPTGYSVPGITGHPPTCLEQEEYDRIKKECPNF